MTVWWLLKIRFALWLLRAAGRLLRWAATAAVLRFTELEQEREQIDAQLAGLAKTSRNDASPELLDALPLLGDILAGAPTRLQAALYQAFSIELLYNKDMHQVTIWATITDSTPRTLAAIIADSEDPAPAFTASTAVSDLPQHPGGHQNFRDHGNVPARFLAGRHSRLVHPARLTRPADREPPGPQGFLIMEDPAFWGASNLPRSWSRVG